VLEGNSILFYELLRASHRRRTWLLRAALPGFAIIWVGPQIMAVSISTGQDWRAVAGIARPAFTFCAWASVALLPLMGLFLAAASLKEEWTRGTMEVLCVTPIGRTAIIHAKFAGIISRLFLTGLAAIPVMGMGHLLGNIPREMALAALGAIAAATVFFTACGMFYSAAYRPKGRQHVLVLVAVFVLLALGSLFNHPWLLAFVPPRAMWYVLTAQAPGGMTASVFTALAVLAPLVAGLALLAMTPILFRHTFNRHISGGGKRPRLTPVFTARARAWRARLMRREIDRNPYAWQEILQCGRKLRNAYWAGYIGGCMVSLAALCMLTNSVTILASWEPYLTMGITGAVLLIIMSWSGGANVFQREKARRAIEPFALSVASIRALYLGKLRAIIGSLRSSWLGIIVPLVLFILRATIRVEIGASTPPPLIVCLAISAAIVTAAFLGSCLLAVIGMVFSAAARNRAQMILAYVAAPLSTTMVLLILGSCVLSWFGIVLVGTGVVWFKRRFTWTIWNLSYLLGLTLVVGILAGTCTAVLIENFWTDRLPAIVISAIGNSLLIVAFIVAWVRLGIISFEHFVLGVSHVPR